MNSYIPVISEVLDTKHDSCLVDAKKVLKNKRLNGFVVVSKAEVYPLACEKWWFSIEDNKEKVVIVEHCPGFKCSDTVDIIEILGHELTLLPEQRLLFHTDGKMEQTVSYITVA